MYALNGLFCADVPLRNYSLTSRIDVPQWWFQTIPARLWTMVPSCFHVMCILYPRLQLSCYPYVIQLGHSMSVQQMAPARLSQNLMKIAGSVQHMYLMKCAKFLV